MVHSVVALVFAEGCVVFGLMLFFLGAPFGEFLVFAVPSAAVIVLVGVGKARGLVA